MRVITWNIHGAKADSPVWEYLIRLQPELIMLQEVGGLSALIKDQYSILSRVAIYKNGKPQSFSTAVLVKGEIIREIKLTSEYEWINQELEFFKGNLIGCIVKLPNQEPFNVVSVYSPAWSVDQERLKGIVVSQVKLKDNPEVWVTELIWSALKHTIQPNETWVVGGDYNSSETFDIEWQVKNRKRFGIQSHGNREILERMNGLGFNECLRKYNNERIIPTFKHSGGEIAHQLDHLYVTEDIYSRIIKCSAEEQSLIFDRCISDHLPIIADFN